MAHLVLPNNGLVYANSVFERCRNLISFNIWSGIQQKQLDLWIANFKTDEEFYFAGRLLDSLVYRSTDQTIAMMRQLFSRVIPDLARKHQLSLALSSVYTSLRDSQPDPNVRIVPVIPKHGGQIKSGTTYARYLKRHLKFQNRWFIEPTEVENASQETTIIFIDDFLGTGSQFKAFFRSYAFEKLAESRSLIYSPLAGHIQGIQCLNEHFPHLYVQPVETLDESHSLLGPHSSCFPDEVNPLEVANNFYLNLLETRGFTSVSQQGYGGLGLAYFFEHSVPNNTLPIFWRSDNANWNALFLR